jgi:WD40 repeat protein
VRLWSSANAVAGSTLDAHAGPVLALAFAPDSSSLAAGGASGAVVLWNPLTGAQLRTFTGAGGAVRGVAFSRDGARLIAGGDGAGAHVWDAKSGSTLAVVNVGTTLHAVAASPANAMLALAGDDHSVLLRQGE